MAVGRGCSVSGVDHPMCGEMLLRLESIETFGYGMKRIVQILLARRRRWAADSCTSLSYYLGSFCCSNHDICVQTSEIPNGACLQMSFKLYKL